ncbi:MAG: site-2 protease family protein [Nanoarchaeota archaeon]|nr:site-2 protease family protein [Nanoarchaeota archaeon]
MGFLMYDLIFLAAFIIFFSIFLVRKRKGVKKQGLLLLYRTTWGMKLIERIGTKYKKTLTVLSHVSVWLGYVLMAAMLWLFYTVVKVYLLRPDIVTAIKVPPIMPLIPYIDKLVPFLPSFYFTYFIVILAIIAISHEFAHGIFMRRYGIKIKSTGFGFFPFFLPVFLAAFVEQDEKSMVKAKNFEQRAVLAAGTFANTITAVLGLIVLGVFFSAAFTPVGISFNGYVSTPVNITSITSINGVSVVNPNFDKVEELVLDANFNYIDVGDQKYVGIAAISSDKTKLALYDDAPAIKAGLNGAILKINDVTIGSVDKLTLELAKYKPGDTIKIDSKFMEEEKIYEIVLGEHPEDSEKPYLGLAFSEPQQQNLLRKALYAASSFKKDNIYYESDLGEFGWFVYYLLWWLVLISLSVALVNMLPMGIFDGGRFFYLIILKFTKSEKIAANSFKWLTNIILLMVLAIMLYWGYVIAF